MVLGPVAVLLVLLLLRAVYLASTSGRGGGGSPSLLPRQAVRITLGDGQPSDIASQGFRHYDFDLPARACIVTGRILGVAGGNKDFQAMLMDDDNFRNWQTSHHARVYWQTEKVAAATLEARLAGPGTFHLVISNVFSLATTKTITVQGQVTCP